jgi:hypothetical protein
VRGNRSDLTKKEAERLELTAGTTQDHLRLAAYYRALALKLEDRARLNEEKAESYRERPLPFDSKQGVPMERQCEQWAASFRQQADQAWVLVRLHEAKAQGTSIALVDLEPVDSQVRSAGLTLADSMRSAIYASPEQSIQFQESMAAGARLFDRTKLLTYVVSAKGEPPVATMELRQSAQALFDEQQQFLQSLSAAQKAAIAPCIHDMEKLRRGIEQSLDRLAARAAAPQSGCYFKAARAIKHDLQSWHVEELNIGERLGIAN